MRPTTMPNRRDLLKARLVPINRLQRWAIIADDVAAYRHYVERWHHEYQEYNHGRGVYAN